ncbi:exonuclease V-like [Ylistrum balloti]|uniref:exonuclease V-like n=1 Tax=Ylistrum balloti TaxID=509963 RepID=UPI002905F6BE|nr:exonuclease V-like [Ylistrum balloti]
MTTLTDKDTEAPKSNIPCDIELNIEHFQLINDDDDEWLSSYVSKMEEMAEKYTSTADTFGRSTDTIVTVTNTEVICSNADTSSTGCVSITRTNNPMFFCENEKPSHSLNSTVHVSDLTNTTSTEVSADQTYRASSHIGPADETTSEILANKTNNSCSEVTRTDQDSGRIPQVIIDHADETTPLEKFRPGYLWVSDLTKQNWCEQQLLYSFTVPGVVVEDPVMTKGSDLHLQRELAVHDVVHVDITSSEDIWAVKLLNLLNSIQTFLSGAPLAREVPIFGAPFHEDVFLVGLIDELRFDLETYAIGLSELKTRLSKSKPSKSQERQHRLQVMLYKKLFDDLVKGNISKDVVARHLRLKLTKVLGESVQEELGKSGLSCKTLDTLLDIVFGRMAAVTCIGETSIEYVHQGSGQSFLHQDVVYDDEELKNMYTHYLEFWRGQRAVEGVDIEDAWKCQRCDYESVCEWRQVKAAECARKNKLGRI